eukprot:1345360-Pyramimonas_sp.AAC.1
MFIVTLITNTIPVAIEPADDPFGLVVRPVTVCVALVVLESATPPGVDVAMLARGAPATATVATAVAVSA